MGLRSGELAKRTVLNDLTAACPGRGPSNECPILETIDSAGAGA